jgi:predicted RNase H-like HicB family nuclease
MNKYEIIVYWSQEDNRFIAEVPELSGCMADGENQIEALKNVNLIIDEWIEIAVQTRRNIPIPKGKLMFA